MKEKNDGYVMFSIGISGCGKTFYGEQLRSKVKDLVVICPDDIRSEMGDISDQSHNREVFNKIYDQLKTSMEAGKNIYYSATNLTKSSRKQFLSLCKKYNKKIIAVVFLTSFRPDICEKRVRKDIDNGVNRSNTLVKPDGAKNVIQVQADKFRQQMRDIASLENELKDNSSSYRIKYIECSRA